MRARVAADALFAAHANYWRAGSQAELVAALEYRGLLSARIAEARPRGLAQGADRPQRERYFSELHCIEFVFIDLYR